MIIPALGKKIKTSFSEITKLRETEGFSGANRLYSYGIYTNKKVYSISDSVIGFNLFMQIAREKNIYIETMSEQVKNCKQRKNQTKGRR